MAKGDKGVRLADFALYIDTSIESCIATAELPTMEAESEDFTGAGFLGTASIPVEGAFGPMQMVLNYNTIHEDIFSTASGTHDYDFRGSQIVIRNGMTTEIPVKVTIRATTQSSALGSFEKNTSTGSSITAEVLYIKIDVDGKNKLELDKANYKYVLDGVDVIAKRRANLGK